MGWFDRAKKEFQAGSDSIQVKKYLESFLINEQQFSQAYDSIGRDLSRMQNYRQQFEMMQKIIDNFIGLADNHKKKGSIQTFLSGAVTINSIGEITVQEAYLEFQKSIDRIHKLIGQNYFRS